MSAGAADRLRVKEIGNARTKSGHLRTRADSVVTGLEAARDTDQRNRADVLAGHIGSRRSASPGGRGRDLGRWQVLLRQRASIAEKPKRCLKSEVRAVGLARRHR